MQRRDSQTRRASSSDISTMAARDPRIRMRSAPLPATADTPLNSPRSLECVSTEGGPTEHESGTAPLALKDLMDTSTLEKAFFNFVSNAIDGGLLRRKRDYLKSQCKAAEDEYGHAQQRWAEFPVYLSQIEGKKKQLETTLAAIEKETAESTSTQNSSTRDLVLLLFAAIARDNERHSSLVAEVTNLQRELTDIQSRQVTQAANSEEVSKRLAKVTKETETLRKSIVSVEGKLGSIEADQLDLKSKREREIELSDKKLNDIRKEMREEFKEARDGIKVLEQQSEGYHYHHKRNTIQIVTTQDYVQALDSKMLELQMDPPKAKNKPQIESLQSGLSDLDRRMVAIETTKEASNAHTSNLTSDISALREISEDQGAKITALEQSAENRAGDLSSSPPKLSDLDLRMTTVENAGKDLDLRMNAVETARTDLDLRVNAFVAAREDFDTRIIDLSGSVSALRKATEDRCAETQALEQRVINQSNDLKSVRQQISDFNRKTTAIEITSKAADAKASNLTSDVSSLRKMIEDQHSKIEALTQTVNDQSKDLKSVPQEISDFGRRINVIETAKKASDAQASNLPGDISSLRTIIEDQDANIKALRQFVGNQSKDLNSFKSSLSHLESEVSMHSFKNSLSRLESEVSMSLAAQTAPPDNISNVSAQELENRLSAFAEMAKHENDTRDAKIVEYVNESEQKLKAKFGSIQKGLAALQQSSQIPITTDLSDNDRQTMKDTVAIVPRVRELEVEIKKLGKEFETKRNVEEHDALLENLRQRLNKHEEHDALVEKLQQRLDKHDHIIEWQTHRFDNLNSDALARRMLGVVAPALPKLEQGLSKIESEVKTLRSKLDEHLAKNAGDFTADQDQRIQMLQDDLKGFKGRFLMDLETLSQQFQKTRDSVLHDIKGLESAQASSTEDKLTHRLSLDKKLSRIEAELADLRKIFKASGTQSLSQEVTERSALAPGGNPLVTSDDLGIRANQNSGALNSVVESESSHKRTGYESTAEPGFDEVPIENECATLLQRFQKQPIGLNSSPRPQTSVRQSPKLSTPDANGPRRKRRRLEGNCDPLNSDFE